MTTTILPTFTAKPDATIAEQIADLVGGDGMQFWTQDLPDYGVHHLQSIMKVNALRVSRKPHSVDVTRYIFPDNSVITVAGDAWDFGYRGCFCWRGQSGDEHQEDCEFSDVSVGRWRGAADAAMNLMDKDITDEMDHDGTADGCRTMQEYVDAYMSRHEGKYGAAFVVN